MRLVLIVLLSVFMNSFTLAEGMTFAIIGKSIDDANFQDAGKACDEAAKLSGDRCVLLGNKGAANAFLQEKILKNALREKQYDAIAVSVISSEYIAKTLKTTNIPVITFDSPLLQKYRYLSPAYVGTDNVEFGYDLARIAKSRHPEGGSVCLMTVFLERNLSLRVLGVRQELSGDNQLTEEIRSDSNNAWTELVRCPWNTEDKVDRSLDQLEFTLKYMKPDAFIAVGHWPILDLDRFKTVTQLFREEMIMNNKSIIIGIGTESKANVEMLMEEQLVHGFVAIDFKEIGRKSYDVMKNLAEGKPVESLNYTPNIIRYTKNK